MPAALVGFMVPFVLFSAVAIVRHYVLGHPRIDMENDLRGLPAKCIAAAVCLAIVFALAAILDTSPAIRFGFVRALLCVGLATLAGAIVTAILIVGIVHLGPRTFSPERWRWLPIFIIVMVPVGYTAIHTAVRFRTR